MALSALSLNNVMKKMHMRYKNVTVDTLYKDLCALSKKKRKEILKWGRSDVKWYIIIQLTV